MNDQNRKTNANTFSAMLLSYGKVYDIAPLFEDFLNLCLCVLSPGALAGFPLDRDRFESILLKYSDPAMPLDFTALFAFLLKEARCRQIAPHQLNCYSDILGDFYEEHILGYDPQNPFLSWDLHEDKIRPEVITIQGESPMLKRKVFDPLCASGRRLLARRWMHTIGEYYGADITPSCAKMTILNLFLHHVPKAEVIWFKVGEEESSFGAGYSFSSISPGIRQIEQAEDSKVWSLMQESVPLAMAA